METKLSVIVPVYNDEKNIIRCLESLFNQTLKELEIIVVNDASTDGTLSVLQAYRNAHEFSIISVETNSGAGHCRNVGIRCAKSPYVTFVDSDDWLDMSTYSICADQFLHSPDVIVFGLEYNDVLHNHSEMKYRYEHNYDISGDYALGLYAHTLPNEIQITPIVNNKIYRKEFLLEKSIFFHEGIKYQEDDAFTFEVLVNANKVKIVSNCCYHYCQRGDSLIHHVSEGAIKDFVAAYSTLEKYLQSRSLFQKYQPEFYLKLKSSFLGVIKRTVKYSSRDEEKNKLILMLIREMLDKLDMTELLKHCDLSFVHSI